MLKADGPDWQKVLAYVESIFRHFEKSFPLSNAWFFLITVSVFQVQKQYWPIIGLYFHKKLVSRSTSDFHMLFSTTIFLCTIDSLTFLCWHLWDTFNFGSIFIYVTYATWGWDGSWVLMHKATEIYQIQNGCKLSINKVYLHIWYWVYKS